MELDRGDNFEIEGEINESFLVMRDELIKRKYKKEFHGKIGSCGMVVGLLPLIRLFFIRKGTVAEYFDLFSNSFFLVGALLTVFSLGYYKVYYIKAKEKYDSLRKEMVSKIWVDVCNCWGSCNHKEDFLKETKEVYGINLYYK